MTNDNKSSLLFLLGGHDLEMLEIRKLLEGSRVHFHDKGLGWGAKASHYRAEIEEALNRGQTPALVELIDDMELEKSGANVVIVDHHGPRAGADKPSALRQVFQLIKAPEKAWGRYYDLVAANDIGYIPAMIQMGATIEEIKKIRRADRCAQGVTEAEDASAKESAASASWLKNGRLVVAHIPHSRTSSLTDSINLHAIASGSPMPENILAISPDQTNFFGLGDIVYALKDDYPGGWYGGALPAYGFWGITQRIDLTDFILARIS